MSYDHFKVLDLVNNWIKFSDTKAGVVIAFNSSILGLVLNKLDKLDIISTLYCSKYLYIISLILFFICNVFSLFKALISVHPSLKAKGDASTVFFGHITGKSLKKLTDEISDVSYHFEKEITEQIKINSDICWKKYEAVSWAIKSTIASVFFLLVSVTVLIITRV